MIQPKGGTERWWKRRMRTLRGVSSEMSTTILRHRTLRNSKRSTLPWGIGHRGDFVSIFFSRGCQWVGGSEILYRQMSLVVLIVPIAASCASRKIFSGLPDFYFSLGSSSHEVPRSDLPFHSFHPYAGAKSRSTSLATLTRVRSCDLPASVSVQPLW